MNQVGTHVLIDLYGADDPGAKSLSLLYQIASLAGCQILEEGEHVFDGGGRTAFLILSQSHASIHTWPEHRYVSVDLYSCKKIEPERVECIVHFTKGFLHAKDLSFQVVERGNPLR